MDKTYATTNEPTATTSHQQTDTQVSVGHCRKGLLSDLALKLIAESPLAKRLVFKGGTALHHCYLPQYRFSEDLDFTTPDKTLDADTVVNTLTRDGLFEVKKLFTSTATIKVERLRFPGVLAQPGAIKVEIDRLQNVVLPTVMRTYANVWNVPVTVPTMDIREICAEKIRATSTRIRYRDFYDLYMIKDSYGIDLSDIVQLIRQKEIRAPISPQAMAANWQVAKKEAADDLRSIYCSRKVSDAEIEGMLELIDFPEIR